MLRKGDSLTVIMPDKTLTVTPDMVEQLMEFAAPDFSGWELKITLTAGMDFVLRGTVQKEFKLWFGEVKHILQTMTEACHAAGYVATLSFT